MLTCAVFLLLHFLTVSLQDNNTDINEIFYVNITNVTLVSGTVVPNSPRIDPVQNQVEVVITESILNRGVVEFTSPSFTRISESSGILHLQLARVNGSQGTVGVHFMTSLVNASTADFNPQSGIVTFSNNATSADLNITIVDDNIAELDEMFTIVLTKPSGGVKIGAKSKVDVVITENDYPYGLLRFVQLIFLNS